MYSFWLWHVQKCFNVMLINNASVLCSILLQVYMRYC